MSAFKKFTVTAQVPADKIPAAGKQGTTSQITNLTTVSVDLEIFNKPERLAAVNDLAKYGEFLTYRSEATELGSFIALLVSQEKDKLLSLMKQKDEYFNSNIKNRGYFARLWRAVKGQYDQI